MVVIFSGLIPPRSHNDVDINSVAVRQYSPAMFNHLK